MSATRQRPRVSVIIAARNAAATLEETLQSVRAQTFPDWEGILIDDGSSDDTLKIARGFAQVEPRLQVTSQEALGLSRARNRGIELATGDWIVFLDADDTIESRHLEALTGVTLSYPHLGGVHCGWVRRRNGEKLFGDEFCPNNGDLFHVLAVRPAFIIHSCLIRRDAVVAAGMFDPNLICCADWDLWQRIARMGTIFGSVREVLAQYRIVPHSSSSRTLQMLDDGLIVVRRGHAADSRVSKPSTKHANGSHPEGLFSCEVHLVCWSAAALLMEGRDPMPTLDRLATVGRFSPAARSIAVSMLDAFLLRTSRPLDGLLDAWSTIAPATRNFLQAAETRLGSTGFAASVETALVGLMLNRARPVSGFSLGKTIAVQLDVAQEIKTLEVPRDCERVHCLIFWRSRHLGAIELPAIKGRVSAYVLRDAIAIEFFWLLLDAYFHESLYPGIEVQSDNGKISAWRNGTRLETWDSTAEDPASELHDRAGWTFFLQELWGKPEWNGEKFYLEVLPSGAPNQPPAGLKQSRIEIGEPLPEGLLSGTGVSISLAGIPLGILPSATEETFPAEGWIAKITSWAGLELCRVAVRELVIGWHAGPTAMRDRLQLLVKRRNSGGPCSVEDVLVEQGIEPPVTVLGRRNPTTIGSSDSRRAMLPEKGSNQLVGLAVANFEEIIQPPGLLVHAPVVYSPELFIPTGRSDKPREHSSEEPKPSRRHSLRLDFESLFAGFEDPWGYTNEFEQLKYRQTLSLLAERSINRALELACAEGHFTRLLAPLVGTLEGTDFSEIALSRARARCADLPNVSFRSLDLMTDSMGGKFDLIVCSECLYYLPGREALVEFAQRVAQGLTEGGWFLTTHANVVADDPEKPGRDWNVPFGAKTIEEVFCATNGLQLVSQLLTPLYRVQLFQHVTASGQKASVETRTAEMGPLPPKVAARVKWKGGKPADDRPGQGTERLPILMYHRIATLERSQKSRYCVDPEMFARQMQFLHDAGAYTTTLQEWNDARTRRRPLPGKAVLLTFDDGYLDFGEAAWPILRRLGFSAKVFLVTAKVGATSDWSDNPSPLLGWDQIRGLRQQGVEFGSHSHTHPSLLTLTFDEMVRECAESRRIIERELGERVDAFSYPYGETDRIAQHFVGACGYRSAVGTRGEYSRLFDSPLDLPRLEVSGHWDLQDFVSNLWTASV